MAPPRAFYLIVSKVPMILGFPYWVKSFWGKQIIYDKEDELQENDSKFLYTGIMQ